jgi:hypothetical protein
MHPRRRKRSGVRDDRVVIWFATAQATGLARGVMRDDRERIRLAMTSASPIKFRCFQCHKLLGVSPSKVGAVVSCPRCAAELIVPDPSDDAEAGTTSEVEAVSLPPTPPEVVAPKTPSSSRIAPAVVPWDAPPEPDSDSRVERPAQTIEAAFAGIKIEPVSLRPEPSRVRTEPRPTPPREAVILPELKVDPPSIREEAAPRLPVSPGLAREIGPRRSDVVLPRTAVVLWSFLVLLAVVSAFTAGLLVGRFLWAPGVAVSSPTVRAK